MGHMDSISLLLESGASLTTVDKDGVNAIGQFIKTDNIDLLEIFLKEAI